MGIEVKCTTKKQANKLCNYFHWQGYKWNSGDILLNNAKWDDCDEFVIYQVWSDKTITYEVGVGSLSAGFKTVKFEDFDFEPDNIYHCLHNYNIDLCSSKEHGLDCSSCYHLGGAKLPNGKTIEDMWEEAELELQPNENNNLPPLFVEQVLKAKEEESEDSEFSETSSNNYSLANVINILEHDLKTATQLNTFQIGITLQVLKDRLWDIDSDLAQRCNDLSKQILEGGNNNAK